MKNIRIAKKTLSLELGKIERDTEAGSAWRNGVITLEDGTRIDCGGGWIENEESANQKNEEAGIAGGLGQGICYPNETFSGDFSSYDYGEDETGWQENLMPVLCGADWEDREDGDDEASQIYEDIQKGFAAIHAMESMTEEEIEESAANEIL